MFTLRPVEGKNFVNREDLIEDVLTTLTSPNIRMGFAFYGKRRVGKTSLLLELRRQLTTDPNIVPVYFSFWDLVDTSCSAFAKELTTAIVEAYSEKLSLKYKITDLVNSSREFMRKLLSEVSLGIKIRDDLEFLLRFTETKKDPGELLERVFDLPEQLGQETNTRCILLLDEFPAVMDLKNGASLGEGVVRKIRTIHEEQKHTILCISGSIRHTMDLVVFSSASAFYKQLISREVKPLEEKDIKKLIRLHLPQHSIEENVVREIVNFSQGIPFYIQVIGRELHARKRDMITTQDVQNAVEQFLQEEGTLFFRQEFQWLSIKERKIVLAIAQGKHTPSVLASAAEESVNTIGTYLLYLIEKGIVRKEERGMYFLEDPIFAQWLQLQN